MGRAAKTIMFTLRAKYGRRDSHYLAGKFFSQSAPGIAVAEFVDLNDPTKTESAKIVILDEFTGMCSFGVPTAMERIALYLPGRAVPCYRIKSPENNYCICQDFRYKSFTI